MLKRIHKIMDPLMKSEGRVAPWLIDELVSSQAPAE